jgi:hypothetical protein
VTLRKVKVPLGDGWVLYWRLCAERIREVLGGRKAGDARCGFEAGIDPVISSPWVSVMRDNRRRKRTSNGAAMVSLKSG